jgi:hypothetical protein
MMYSGEEGERVPGAKALSCGALNVRDKSRTYLRSNNKNSQKQQQELSDAKARTLRSKSKNSQKQKQELREPGYTRKETLL